MMHAVLPSPLGELLLRFDDDALAGLWFADERNRPATAESGPRDDSHPIARRVAAACARYFAGEPAGLDVPLAMAGTPFQRAVWDALTRVGRGTTVSYGEIARRIGAPAAVRAVGAAVGRNPIAIFVPCHRVVGSDGSLTGYAGGLSRKVHLLRLERVLGEDGRVRAAGRAAQAALPLGAGAAAAP
jgi:methylated-DNA-[protein]-cysteine S-methyltransferase